MKRARMWTLVVAVGALGVGDWFVGPLPADESAAPALTVGGATVSAAVRPVEEDGKKVDHLFLELKGKGAGTLKLRLMETTGNPMSRVMAMPTTVWEKEIAVDTARSTSVDLGAMSAAKGQRDLLAANDGKTFAMLWSAFPMLAEVTP